MNVRLSPEQQAALDLRHPVSLSAGAGSGKTGVLIERYLRALADTGFDLGAVLAVTFTKKATAEMLVRIRTELVARIRDDPANADAWRRVRAQLSDAWIMTIDAFCHRLLTSMGPAAGLAAQRRILTGGALAEIMNEAMRQVIDRIADDPGDADYESLRILLRALGRGDLASHLARLIERRARAVPWARTMLDGPGSDPDRVAAAVALLGGGLPAPAGSSEREQHALQVALARIFERLLVKYRELLAASGGCDFRQLLEDASEKLRDERVRQRWAGRFRHVLVDEFQDTDGLQWEVFRRLFGTARIERPGIFVVGDEKQAIFSFRDGDVVTFHEAAREISDARGVALTLTENYRSTPRLVGFFNRLSETLFSGSTEDFEARHAVMSAARERKPETLAGIESQIEVLIGRGDGLAAAREAELHAIAARIQRFLGDRTRVCVKAEAGATLVRPAVMADVAILLRARTILPELEAALTAHGIPFRVLGGVGFYEQHEVRALCNLMRFLADEEDDLALLGVLRSALFAIPDSALLAAVHRSSEHARGPLWRKVGALAVAVRSGSASLPTQADDPVLVEAVERLGRYRALADRLPANELLALAVSESDLLLTLGVTDPSGRAAANVEKLLDFARRCRAEGIATLDGIARTISLAESASDTPEAQADPPASDAVSILTVHSAKGLEWPIVFVPSLDGAVASGRHGEDAPPARLRQDVGLPFLHEVEDRENGHDTPLHRALKGLVGRERLAELERLLYVAATRARDHLVFSGAVATGKPPGETKADSWLKWVLAARDPSIPVLDPASAATPQTRRAHPVFDRGSLVGEAGPLRPARVAPARLTIPATALATLRTCPRRFFIEQVIGDVSAGRGPQLASSAGWGGGATGAHSTGSAQGPAQFGGSEAVKVPARVRGSIVHAALEGIASRIDPVSRVAPVAARFGIVDGGAVAGLENQVRKAMEGFRAWPVGRQILEDARPGTVRAEVPVDLGAGSCRITGAIDLLHEPETGGATIVDFKTDAIRGDLRALAAEHGYVDQLRAYSAAAWRRRGAPVAAWLFFTESGLALQIVGEGSEESGVVSAEACADEMGRALEGVPGIVAAGFPLTPDPAACAACPHCLRVCPGSSRGI